jgi:hypothetical protein
MVYCKAVTFDRAAVKSTCDFSSDTDDVTAVEEMSSFSETKAKELMVDGEFVDELDIKYCLQRSVAS